MKKLFLLIIVIALSFSVTAQSTYPINADTVKIKKSNGGAAVLDVAYLKLSGKLVSILCVKDTIKGITGVAGYSVDSGTLLKIILIDAPTMTKIACGSSPGSSDIIDWINANPIWAVETTQYFKNATTIYFAGLLPDTVITVFKIML